MLALLFLLTLVALVGTKVINLIKNASKLINFLAKNMTQIANFLKTNKLTQVGLAQFLGITEAAVSNMARGKSNPSEANMLKILSNDRGWDTSMLAPAAQTVAGEGNTVAGRDLTATAPAGLIEALNKALDHNTKLLEQNSKSQEQIDRLLGLLEDKSDK